MPWVAVALASLSVLVTAASLALREYTRSKGYLPSEPHAGDLVLGTLFPAAGALVLSRQPRSAAGWVLLSGGLVSVSALAQQWLHDGAVAGPTGWLPALPVALWLSTWTFWPYWLQPSLLPVLFGDAHRTSAFWRRYVRVVLAVWVAGVAFTMIGGSEDISDLGLSNPLGVPALTTLTMVVQMTATLLLWLVASPVAIVGLVRRQRVASGRERAQLQWLLLGFVLAVGGVLTFSQVAFAVGFAMIPTAVVVAVVRHGLLDVELVVNRAIVYGALTAAGVLAYVAVVAWAGSRTSAPLVAAVVALAAAAARERVQRAVDRRLFGGRRDPLAVVNQVGARLAAAPQAEALRALVLGMAESLKLPYAAIRRLDGDVVEEGRPVAGTHEVPVVHAGRRLGTLVVGARHRGEKPDPREEALLHDLARRAGDLLHADRLSADLQRSRASVVAAREEERRRLRREMHDGLGPALAGMALQLDSLHGRLADDPALASRAARLRERARTAVADVRRIVDGLRPAAVDELGLAEALRSLAMSDGTPVVVDVGELPELPAAVEAAAYRIVGEAVNNALRHSGASRVAVDVALEGRRLRVEVSDDGRGFGAEVTEGVGLSSMHERAAEVGGALTVRSGQSGTRVLAVLPA